MMLALAYARERLTPGRLLPAVLLVVLATLAGRGWAGSGALVTDALIALALVVAFRIWDDVMDRERDRAKHPNRVVVLAPSTAPLRLIAWILALGGIIFIGTTRTSPAAVEIGVYAAVLAASYALRGLPAVASAKVGLPTVALAKVGLGSAAAQHIVLLKYGVFTLALIGLPAAFSLRGLLSAAVAFLAACAYERWHDPESLVFSFGGSQ